MHFLILKLISFKIAFCYSAQISLRNPRIWNQRRWKLLDPHFRFKIQILFDQNLDFVLGRQRSPGEIGSVSESAWTHRSATTSQWVGRCAQPLPPRFGVWTSGWGLRSYSSWNWKSRRRPSCWSRFSNSESNTGLFGRIWRLRHWRYDLRTGTWCACRSWNFSQTKIGQIRIFLPTASPARRSHERSSWPSCI